MANYVINHLHLTLKTRHKILCNVRAPSIDAKSTKRQMVTFCEYQKFSLRIIHLKMRHNNVQR